MAWGPYIAAFHDERGGITESILGRCRVDGLTPYEWAAAAVPDRSPVLDVGAGSGPMHPLIPGWVGVDVSTGELAAADARGRRPLLCSSADTLAVADGSVHAAIAAMALQVVPDTATAVAEISRVLAPDGVVVVLLPATGPLPWRQLAGYLRLQTTLRQRISYPNDELLRPGALHQLADDCDLRVVDDHRRSFRFPLTSADDAEAFLHSLYLPEVRRRRFDRARRVLERRVGGRLDVPLRRVVLRPIP